MMSTIELPDGRRAAVSDLALMHWGEQVCPLRSRTWQLALLTSLAETIGVLTYDPPSWVRAQQDVGPLQCYLILGDFALLVVPFKPAPYLLVVASIPRGSLPRSVRAARNQANATRRRIRAARRRSNDGRSKQRRRRRELLAPVYDGREG